jgi:hypothetical protein
VEQLVQDLKQRVRLRERRQLGVQQLVRQGELQQVRQVQKHLRHQ